MPQLDPQPGRGPVAAVFLLGHPLEPRHRSVLGGDLLGFGKKKRNWSVHRKYISIMYIILYHIYVEVILQVFF